MGVDLHLHSTASDGTETPTAVVELAAAAGLSAIALTDHDNLDGIAEARIAANRVGVDLISGAELSVGWTTGAMHLLVYFLEPGPGPLQDRLVELQQSRANRNQEMVGALNELGIDITYDEILAEAGGTGVGRPHFAGVLIKKGVVPDVETAFDRYLAAGRPAYRGRKRLDAAEAIELARESGAATSIAHPHTIGAGAPDYEAAFAELAAVGLTGVECWYPEYEPTLRNHLAEIAESHGLVATGGSDFHGSYKPSIQVGVGKGDLVVPESTLSELRDTIA
ncbi:MAG: PHP domain-containing protein [Acidimicrobiia bacterium]|nr:PHP domain-containing protein [Acidimicrobiia bacterium]